MPTIPFTVIMSELQNFPWKFVNVWRNIWPIFVYFKTAILWALFISKFGRALSNLFVDVGKTSKGIEGALLEASPDFNVKTNFLEIKCRLTICSKGCTYAVFARRTNLFILSYGHADWAYNGPCRFRQNGRCARKWTPTLRCSVPYSSLIWLVNADRFLFIITNDSNVILSSTARNILVMSNAKCSMYLKGIKLSNEPKR